MTETGRERRKKTNETMKEKKGTAVGAGAGSGPAERNRDDRRVKERKKGYYIGRGWKTELSLGVIHGLILTTAVVIKTSSESKIHFTIISTQEARTPFIINNKTLILEIKMKYLQLICCVYSVTG